MVINTLIYKSISLFPFSNLLIRQIAIKRSPYKLNRIKIAHSILDCYVRVPRFSCNDIFIPQKSKTAKTLKSVNSFCGLVCTHNEESRRIGFFDGVDSDVKQSAC